MESIIKNIAALSKSPIRRDALAILEAGLAAVNVRTAIRRSVSFRKSSLLVSGKRFDLRRFDHIYVFAIGKAAADASAALEEILGSRITDGIALDVKRRRLKRIKSVAGTHPFPSFTNMLATGEIMAFLKNLDSRDLVVTVISGGGSALLCWPFQLKCDEVALVTKTLMARGADIGEINIVRKHLSEIQGGQFARMAYPATVVGLIVSDVPGDDLDLIASGPTVRDSSTVNDAARVLSKYNVLKVCKLPGCDLKETPKEPLYFSKVTNVLVASNKDAVQAMIKEARRRDWRPRILSTKLQGEAREIGKMLAQAPKPGEVVIAAGETTVTVRGKGRGGRNQEVVLSALEKIAPGTLVISCASDGIDNSPSAGAIADELTKAKAARTALNARKYLKQNDSYTFFKKTGQNIVTGVTGTNVSDLMIAMRR
ncbi:hypothetical protein A3F28_02070 [Candidatus Uhrbacteria bacterium RIFCSPHIGHO2_12_FULL_57_11]|uniref:Glycerate kinase n=1 Tax=Candidatus Uhrbacteria bacterium RIFCSPHIGHO2_12_FULL_57_11 TaxID=1802398 RepID=A0A1F7UK81_9BACT|nr:MAG: hypothetical protein A3F28_02070 [Candidatus Uhrbacteria bacterium RIFCSPHIGHO2_12_FULL_57_11]